MYNKAVVAIDRDKASAEQVLTAAQGQAKQLLLLHVVPPQEVQYSVDPTFTGSMSQDIEQQVLQSTQKRIAQLCAPFVDSLITTEVLIGHAPSLIRKFAEDHGCDLIIMGTHGRHGWRRILGSTAIAVLHEAPVDVLMHRLEP